MNTNRKNLLGSTVVQFEALVYDNTLGIMYDEEVELEGIPFSGWYTYTPGTSHNRWGDPGDPPEFNGDVECKLSENEVLTMVDKWFEDWPCNVSVVDCGYEDLVTQLSNTVMDDTVPWEVDPHDEY